MIFSTLYAFDVTISKPVQYEKWTRGQSSNATIEWASGNTPVALPTGFPKSLDIWFVDSNKQQIAQLTNFDPSTNARWVFDSNNVVPKTLDDGEYYIALVNSQDHQEVAYSPFTIEISGGPHLNNATTTLITNSSTTATEKISPTETHPLITQAPKHKSSASTLTVGILGVFALLSWN